MIGIVSYFPQAMQWFLNEKIITSCTKQNTPFKTKNSTQCSVLICASIVDFYESVFNTICKKWFSFNYAE